MSVLSQAFRRVAAQACAGRLFREFMAAGLEDIQEEADADDCGVPQEKWTQG